MSEQVKISYGPTGTETVLGDDSAGDYITFDERDHERIVQREPAPGAASQVTFARDNRRNGIGFFVDKNHADAGAAMLWWSDHPDALPSQGKLKWVKGAVTRWLNDATLERVKQVRFQGKETVFHYSFTGGLITQS